MQSGFWGRRVAAVLLAAFGFVACTEEPPPPPEVARPVKIFELGSSDVVGDREYAGEITASANTQVAFEVSGKLVAFPVRESQQVRRGEVLAKLDPRDFKADLEAAVASTGAAKADFDRYTILYREDVAPLQQLEKAERNHEVLKAREATARKALEDTVLRAPFEGTVARKLVDDFANVQAKEPVVTLQTGGGLEIVVNIPEQVFAGIRSDATVADLNETLDVVVVVSALPGREFPAVLKEFATTADAVTRTFPVTFSFDPPQDVNIRPGMTAKVVSGRDDAGEDRVTIPAGAALEGENGSAFVWVVDPDSMQVRRVPVTLGQLTGSSVEIRGDLQKGVWVAVSGVHQLREGMEVRRLEN